MIKLNEKQTNVKVKATNSYNRQAGIVVDGEYDAIKTVSSYRTKRMDQYGPQHIYADRVITTWTVKGMNYPYDDFREVA